MTDSKHDSISMFGVVVHDTKRFAQIAGILRKFGFGNLYKAAKSGVSGDLKSSEKILQSFKDKPSSMAENVRAAIEELGTTYIKFGQMLSTRYDLLPKEMIAELEKLQDGSPKLPFETIEGILNDTYGDYHTVFSSFDEVPLGAASIAQAHRAVLTDGTKVVVKIQRPGLLPLIRSDIDILNLLARALDSNIEEIAYFNLPALIAEFEASIVSELDFNNERANIEYFIAKYGSRPMFVFPKPYPELTHSNILVMREIEGVKITTIPTGTPEAADMASAILDIAFDMVFRDGIFHGDPHPGNVFATPEGKIGLLDFGLVGSFTLRQRQEFMRLVMAIQLGDYALIARTLMSLGHPTRRVILADLEAEIAVILQKYLKSSLKNLDIAAFAADFIAAGQRFGVQIPSDFTNAVRALINIEGIIQYLNPDLDLIETIANFSRNLMADNFNQKNITNQIVQDIMNLGDYARTLPSHATQLMLDLEHDGIAVRIDEKAVTPIADAVNSGAARISISCMLPLLAICLYIADLKILFSIILIAAFIWLIAVPFIYNSKKINRQKLRISPYLSNMQRRKRWF